MARSKNKLALAINNLADADQALAEMAELQAGLARMEEELNEGIAAMKLKTQEQAAPLQARKAALEDAVQAYAKVNKRALFSDAKSVCTAHGSFGFRTTPPALKPEKGITWARVLERLQEKGMAEYIRATPEVDREALKKAGDDIKREAGVKLASREEFWVTAHDEKIPKIVD